MREMVLPTANYIFTTGQVRQHYGGQTISMMRRARLFAAAGTPVTVTTIDSWQGYSQLREEWTASGVITSGVTLRNIHEEYRSGDLRELLQNAAPRQESPLLGIPAGYRPYENPIDGENMKRFWFPPDSKQHRYTEYLRADGSVFMRTLSNPGVTEWEEPARVVGFYDRCGEFIGGFGSHQEWWNHWMRSVVADNRTYIINDYEHPLFFGLGAGPTVTKIQAIHSAHAQSLSNPMGAVKQRWHPLERGQEIADGIVFLTWAQEKEWGERLPTNMRHAVIPHPVDAAPALASDYVPSRKCIVVSRLDANKNVTDTIRAFRLASDGVDGATLDIHGAGVERDLLEELCRSLGIDERVRFLGPSPDARENYSHARLSIFTSKTEGFGLSILESLTRGCPAVAYDIRYGPADMIDTGHNGHLVPFGDVEGLAVAIRKLLTDDSFALSARRASVHKADAFSESSVIAAWAVFLGGFMDGRSTTGTAYRAQRWSRFGIRGSRAKA